MCLQAREHQHRGRGWRGKYAANARTGSTLTRTTHTVSGTATSAHQKLKVYLRFEQRSGWDCQFLKADLRTPLPRKLRFATPEKVLQRVEHTGALKDWPPVEHGLQLGKGGVYLMLSPEQNAKLKGR